MKNTVECKGIMDYAFNGGSLTEYKVEVDLLKKIPFDSLSDFAAETMSLDTEVVVNGWDFLTDLKCGIVSLGISGKVRHILIDGYLTPLVVYVELHDNQVCCVDYEHGTRITEEVFIDLCDNHTVLVDVDKNCYRE